MQQRVSERAATPCITPTVNHGRCSIMVFKGFCQLQSREFVSNEGQIESDRLSQHTAASCDPVWNTAWESRICTQSKEKQHALQLISLLAQSANLNPIQLVRDELDQKVRAKPGTSATHLWQLLPESWAELSSVYLQSLVERAGLIQFVLHYLTGLSASYQLTTV